MNAIEQIVADQGIRTTDPQVQRAVRAATERELEIRESLIAAGTRLGASVDQIEEVLDDAGLVAPERPTVGTGTAQGGGDLDDRLSRLESAVQRLTDLAERHLPSALRW